MEGLLKEMENLTGKERVEFLRNIIEKMMNTEPIKVENNDKVIIIEDLDRGIHHEFLKKIMPEEGSFRGVVLNRFQNRIERITFCNEGMIVVELDVNSTKRFIVVDTVNNGVTRVCSMESAMNIKELPPFNGLKNHSVLSIHWTDSLQNDVPLASIVALCAKYRDYGAIIEDFCGLCVNHIKPTCIFKESIQESDVELVSEEDNGKHWRAYEKLLNKGIIALNLRAEDNLVTKLCKNEALEPKDLKIRWCTPSAIETLELEGLRPEVLELIQKKLDELYK